MTMGVGCIPCHAHCETKPPLARRAERDIRVREKHPSPGPEQAAGRRPRDAPTRRLGRLGQASGRQCSRLRVPAAWALAGRRMMGREES